VVGLIALAMVGALTAGCGSSDRDPPSGQGRLAVVSFLRAAQERRFVAACVFVAPEARADLRLTVLGSFRPDGRTTAMRSRQVARARRLATDCPGTVEVLASELGSGIAGLRSRVAEAQPTWLDRDHKLASLDDQAWVVAERQGRWQFVTSNAIADALQ
jgi:hypothetical protein